MSSQRAVYARMAPPYLIPVVNFTTCIFGHFVWTCSTPVFYTCTVKKILKGSSASQKTLTFSTHTGNIVCWVTRWSLSLWSVQCPLWSVTLQSLCSVQYSLWPLSLCSLPPLCSGDDRPRSSYNLTSKRCSSQSLLPLQHSAVPKILQWKSTAIKTLLLSPKV
jgi:hypothetical protein